MKNLLAAILTLFVTHSSQAALTLEPFAGFLTQNSERFTFGPVFTNEDYDNSFYYGARLFYQPNTAGFFWFVGADGQVTDISFSSEEGRGAFRGFEAGPMVGIGFTNLQLRSTFKVWVSGMYVLEKDVRGPGFRAEVSGQGVNIGIGYEPRFPNILESTDPAEALTSIFTSIFSYNFVYQHRRYDDPTIEGTAPSASFLR